jgi:hypothetical protein
VIQGESDYHGWQPSGSQPSRRALPAYARSASKAGDWLGLTLDNTLPVDTANMLDAT